MGVVLARARQAGGPSQSEHALRSSPWPRPSAPRAFSNLREPLHTREPARVGSDRMGGANGPPGWPRPSRAGSSGHSSPPPSSTPAKNTSRPRSPGMAAAGSVAPPPPPAPVPRAARDLSHGAPGAREPGRAPPLKTTGASSLAVLQTMGTPEQPRPQGEGCRGQPTPPIVSTLAPGAEAHSWRWPPPHQAASPGSRDKRRGSARASQKRRTTPTRRASEPPAPPATLLEARGGPRLVPILPSPPPKPSLHPPAQSQPPGHTLSPNSPGRAQKRQTAARDPAQGLRIG